MLPLGLLLDESSLAKRFLVIATAASVTGKGVLDGLAIGMLDIII